MRNKYGAIKTTYDGITFDSKKEGERYLELKALQLAGKITGLTIHPKFELLPGFVYRGEKIRPIVYEADFQYLSEDGDVIVEDVKGMRTKDYILKRKMFLAKFPFYNFSEPGLKLRKSCKTKRKSIPKKQLQPV